MAKISVIIPVYGVEKYLEEALESVLNQTLKDIEIILIDDGSKDRCPQIIDEYAARDSRIIAIHKPNGGYGQTMNVGLSKAQGEYVAILEPDDYIEPKMYEDLYDIAKKFDSDIVKSPFYDNLQAKTYSKISKVKWNDFIPEDRSFTIKEYPYFLYYHPSVWSCIYKHEFLNKNNIRFVEAPGAGWTDNPFQVQTMCLAERINYTSNPYYYWRRMIKNENSFDELKDYRIPFLRTAEIHKWLEENNITDENILLHLFRREVAYIKIVLMMKKWNDKNDCYKCINELISKFPENIYLSSNEVRADEKKFYAMVKKNPKLVRFKIISKLTCEYWKYQRRKIIQFRWGRKEKYICLFGKEWRFDKEPQALARVERERERERE